MLNNNATQKPSTLKPLLRILLAIRIIPALITNKNKPSETTVIGKVRNINTGFRKILSNMITKETKIAADIPWTSTPGIKESIKKMANAIDITFTKNFIKRILSINYTAKVKSNQVESQINFIFLSDLVKKTVFSIKIPGPAIPMIVLFDSLIFIM